MYLTLMGLHRIKFLTLLHIPPMKCAIDPSTYQVGSIGTPNNREDPTGESLKHLHTGSQLCIPDKQLSSQNKILP